MCGVNESMTTMNFLAGIISAFRETIIGFQAKDFLDILIVTFLVYAVLLLLKRTHALFMASGLIIFLGIYVVGRFFNLYLTSIVFQEFFTFFAVILAVIFQKELRNFFEWLYLWGRISRRKQETVSEQVTELLLEAVAYLARHNIGALIVLEREQPIERFLEGGVVLKGKVSLPILLSIFDSSSPGHDGAVIIERDRIRKFGAHLPLADRFDRARGLGTRHRAALGLSERTDALVIVVSEERGTISVAEHGELKVMLDSDALRERVREAMHEKFYMENERRWYSFFSHNAREKIFAFLGAMLLWFIFVVQFGAGITTRQFSVPIEFRTVPRGYVVEQVVPKEISLTLSGKTQDFNLLHPDDLQVVVFVPENTEGTQKIDVNEKFISRPASLSVIAFSPKVIRYVLKKGPQ